MTEKFNIIIPTRERANTLFHCLRTIVAQDYPNLSIIVSDNFSCDNTKEVVYSFNDPRIKYINTGKRISMSDNWEFALNHVTDGWVTIIGDDDGLLFGALSKLDKLIKKTHCQAIMTQWCHFAWSNYDENAPLIIPMTKGFEIRNSKYWLTKVMQGKASYIDLPMLYTGGFVNIQVINKARSTSGNFFLSMIPDVYSSIAISSVLDNYVFLKEPVALAGVSSHSSGASSLGIGNNKTPGQLFFSEKNIPFHKKLEGGELVKSIPILIYECYLQSFHLHQDFLSIKLEDQLCLALLNANNKHFNDLLNFCEKIALINNINIQAILKQLNKLRRRSFLYKLNQILKSLSYQKFLGKSFGIETVYDAVIFTNIIINVKICLIDRVMFFRLLKRLFEKLINLNFRNMVYFKIFL